MIRYYAGFILGLVAEIMVFFAHLSCTLGRHQWGPVIALSDGMTHIRECRKCRAKRTI